MKNILFVTTLILSISINSVSNPNTNELPSGYYMVVAAYAATAENYAVKYVQELKEKGVDAEYGFSYTKELFFVYSATYSTKSEAIKAITFERERTGEDKAWVYVYHSSTGSTKPLDKITTTLMEEKDVVVNEKELPKEKIIPEKTETPFIVPEQIEEPAEEVTAEKTEVPLSHKGFTYLFIEAIDATTGKPITIDFQVIDLARKKRIASAQSQSSFILGKPNSASRMIQVQSNDIGWQKQSFDFKFYEPIIDPMSIFLDNLGDTTFVTFEMKPIKKGEIVTLYQVFFYKDAAIMMDKSGYELDQVVSLLVNNPNLKIVIHGHTNGNSPGKIIALKDHEDVDFFGINGDHKELAGSAAKLSAERAIIVGRYLESRGISTSRFAIKGWGGKKMIYDKHSPKARYNVRVEIEVVDN